MDQTTQRLMHGAGGGALAGPNIEDYFLQYGYRGGTQHNFKLPDGGTESSDNFATAGGMVMIKNTYGSNDGHMVMDTLRNKSGFNKGGKAINYNNNQSHFDNDVEIYNTYLRIGTGSPNAGINSGTYNAVNTSQLKIYRASIWRARKNFFGLYTWEAPSDASGGTYSINTGWDIEPSMIWIYAHSGYQSLMWHKSEPSKVWYPYDDNSSMSSTNGISTGGTNNATITFGTDLTGDVRSYVVYVFGGDYPEWGPDADEKVATVGVTDNTNNSTGGQVSTDPFLNQWVIGRKHSNIANRGSFINKGKTVVQSDIDSSHQGPHANHNFFTSFNDNYDSHTTSQSDTQGHFYSTNKGLYKGPSLYHSSDNSGNTVFYGIRAPMRELENKAHLCKNYYYTSNNSRQTFGGTGLTASNSSTYGRGDIYMAFVRVRGSNGNYGKKAYLRFRHMGWQGCENAIGGGGRYFGQQAARVFQTNDSQGSVVFGNSQPWMDNNQVVDATIIQRCHKAVMPFSFRGDSSGAITMPHGLGVKPELICYWGTRNNINGTQTNSYLHHHMKNDGTNWWQYLETLQSENHTNNNNYGTGYHTQEPDDTNIYWGTSINNANKAYVGICFATLPGFTKVGGYTGNGSSQTIDCGFSNGLEACIIKRVDANGNQTTQGFEAQSEFYFVGAARPMNAYGNGNGQTNTDHFFQLGSQHREGYLWDNGQNGEIKQDWYDYDNSGFIIKAGDGVQDQYNVNLNVNGAKYIFIAFAKA